MKEYIALFTCSICGQDKVHSSSCSTGYGYNSKGEKVCYSCCALQDIAQMQTTGKITLYLEHDTFFIDTPYARINHITHAFVDGKVSNWPGSLQIRCRVKQNKNGHNWGLNRYDAWFTFQGEHWHGIQYGDDTQLIHCKRLKS